MRTGHRSFMHHGPFTHTLQSYNVSSSSSKGTFKHLQLTRPTIFYSSLITSNHIVSSNQPMLRFPPAEYEWPSTSRSSKTSNVMTEDHEDHDNFHQNHQIHLGLLRLHRPHHPSASTTDLLPYPADKTPNAPYSPNVSWFPPLLPTDGRVQGIRWYPDDEDILDLDFENTRTRTVRPRDTCSFDVESAWLSISGADHDSDGRMLSQPKTDSVEAEAEDSLDVEESESLHARINHTSGSTTEASSGVPVGVPPFLLPFLSREGTPSSSSSMMMMMILDNNDSNDSNDSTQRPKTNHRANRANRPSPPGVLVSSPRQSHTGSNRTTTTSTLSNPGPRPDPPSSFSSPFSSPFSSLATYQNTDTENTSERVPTIPSIPSYDTPSSSYGFGFGSSFSFSSNLPNPKSDERYPSYPHKLPHRPHKPHNPHTHKSARYSPYPNNPNPPIQPIQPIQIQPIQRPPNPPPPRLDRSYHSYRLAHTPTPGSTKGLMEYTIEFSHTNNTPEDEARFLAQVEGRRAREVKREVNRQRREMKREMRVGMDRQGRDWNLNWNGGYDYRRRLSLTSNM
ncbi:hypothetical protein EV361DRAFT_675628 [Lentinula raphanica]|nr:hypothetical protein EV361DRAFT_675628 [Lentinula raphanica]